MSVDLLTPAQTAIFTALKTLEGDPTLPAGAKAFQHIPENTQPPLWVIGRMDSVPDLTIDEQLETITFDVVAFYRGLGRAPLIAMVAAARNAIEAGLSANGAQFDVIRCSKIDLSEQLKVPEGSDYEGLMTFTMFAQPA